MIGVIYGILDFPERIIMMIISTGSPTLLIPPIQSDRDTLAVLAMKGPMRLTGPYPSALPSMLPGRAGCFI